MTDRTNERGLLSKQAAAQWLGVSVDQLDRLIAAGQLAVVPIAPDDAASKRSHVRLSVATLEAFVRRRERYATPAAGRRAKRQKLEGIKRYLDDSGRPIKPKVQR